MINVITNEKEKLELEIDNLTIVELLRNELWADESVSISAWTKKSPTANPLLIIQTKGKSPKKVLLDCLERLGKINDSIAKEFKAVVKK